MINKYKPGIGSRARIKWLRERLLGLDQFEKTRGLTAPLYAQNDDLKAKTLAREAAEEALEPARVAYRFAEYRNDQVLKGLNHAAASVDGRRGGPTAKALYPETVRAVVTASGPAQLHATRKFLEHFGAAREPGVVALREEWMPKVQKAHDDLAATLTKREEAYAAVALARAHEEAARRDHEMAVERLLGEVRAATAGDRALQDAIFPPAADGRGEEEAEASEPADLGGE